MGTEIKQHIAGMKAELVQLREKRKQAEEKELAEQQKAERSYEVLTHAFCVQYRRIPIENLASDGLVLFEPTIEILLDEDLGARDVHGEIQRIVVHARYKVHMQTIPLCDWKNVVDGTISVAAEKVTQYITRFEHVGEVKVVEHILHFASIEKL
jgi:hypothetical protein